MPAEVTRLPRDLPHDGAAERAVLGAILLAPEKLETAALKLAPDDFYDPENREIFAAMLALAARNVPADIVSVAGELARTGALARAGGQACLLELQGSPPSTDLSGWVTILAEKSGARRLLSLMALAENALRFPSGRSVAAIREELEEGLAKLGDGRRTAPGPLGLREALASAIAFIRESRDRGADGITGVATGYAELDRLTAGFRPGELIVVGARPTMGKTTFGLNLAEGMAFRSGAPAKPVLVFSLEMSAREIALRLLASMARADLGRLLRCRPEPDEMRGLAEAVNRVSQFADPPIIISEEPVTAAALCSIARRQARLYGGLCAVVVDYLQRVTVPSDGRRPRYELIGEVSWALKSLAKELQIPVVALAQVDRNLEKSRQDRRPVNADLRESGAIEQDADVIMFIHREEVYHKDDPTLKGRAEIIISKHRNGPTGTVNMFFQGNYARFTEVSSINREQTV